MLSVFSNFFCIFSLCLSNQTVNILRGVKMIEISIRVLKNHRSYANMTTMEMKSKMNEIE